MNKVDKEMPQGRTIQEYSNIELERSKKMVLILSLSVCLLAIMSLSFLVFSKDRLFLSSPSTYSENLFKDVCFNGFHSITQRSGESAFVETSYLESLEDLNYEMVDLKPKPKDYRLIEERSEGKCKIIVSTDTPNKRNLRAFIVTVQEINGAPFEYKVSNVAEILLEKADRGLL